MDAKKTLILSLYLGFTSPLWSLSACKSAGSSRIREAAEHKTRYCSLKASRTAKTSYIEENGQACKVAKLCQSGKSDPDGDGWGWEDEESCRVKTAGPTDGSPDQDESSRPLAFDTTYYPYGMESYFKTTCGDAQDHGGMYFAVTENSPLWPHTCELDSWAACEDEDCLSKWERLPTDVKKEISGKKLVREPRCDVPCGQRHRITNADKSIVTTAVIYDACPSQHWNNRFKEVTEGKNPCAAGIMHLDLRKPLYHHLNGGKISDNIKVWVDPLPLD
ncbi:MAG: hypothetical protein FJ146_16250 [Deltaproteobacteria bacterium]|nr:hypothetical protein [Deltaproteobacteria bacterium]